MEKPGLGQRVLSSSTEIGGILAAVTRGLNMSIAEGLLAESEQFARLAPSHDLSEGLAAWRQRRDPHYTGQ